MDSPFPKAGKVIIVNRWHSKRDINPATTMVREWAEALEMLKGEQGAHAKVAVYPYCALQMPPFPQGIESLGRPTLPMIGSSMAFSGF